MEKLKRLLLLKKVHHLESEFSLFQMIFTGIIQLIKELKEKEAKTHMAELQ